MANCLDGIVAYSMGAARGQGHAHAVQMGQQNHDVF
jgi:hypothetical protein